MFKYARTQGIQLSALEKLDSSARMCSVLPPYSPSTALFDSKCELEGGGAHIIYTLALSTAIITRPHSRTQSHSLITPCVTHASRMLSLQLPHACVCVCDCVCVCVCSSAVCVCVLVCCVCSSVLRVHTTGLSRRASRPASSPRPDGSPASSSLIPRRHSRSCQLGTTSHPPTSRPTRR